MGKHLALCVGIACGQTFGLGHAEGMFLVDYIVDSDVCHMDVSLGCYVVPSQRLKNYSYLIITCCLGTCDIQILRNNALARHILNNCKPLDRGHDSIYYKQSIL